MIRIMFYHEYDNWTYGSESVRRVLIKNLKKIRPIIEPIVTVIKNAIGNIVEILYEFIE